MWREIKEQILSKQRILGLELILGPEGALTFFAVLLASDGGKVLVEKTYPKLSSWQELVNTLPDRIPIAMAVTGRAVFQKAVQDAARFEGEKIVSAILPTVDAGDFYYQLVHAGGADELFVVKKEILDPVLERAEQLSLNVASVQLGYSPLIGIITLIASTSGELNTGAYCLKLADGSINFKAHQGTPIPHGEPVNLAGEEVSGLYLTAYAAALDAIIRGPETLVGIASSYIEGNASGQRYDQKFRIAVAFTLAVTLALLLVNFLLFSYYYGKGSGAASSDEARAARGAQYAAKKGEVGAEEAFFLERGWLKGYRLSLLASRLAAGVPDSVQLTALSIFPAHDHAGDGSPRLTFSRDTVLSSGSCKSPAELDDWLTRLRRLEEVRKVNVAAYRYNPRSGRSEFTLETVLN